MTKGENTMEDIHAIFTEFKKDFPKINELHENLGKEIHENSGPLDEKSRWLVKISISAACGHKRALKTHLIRARNSGLTDEEIKHSLLLLIPTAGFPTFMKAYSVFRSM
jgi:4-carboxymuconolactone decarboxylase